MNDTVQRYLLLLLIGSLLITTIGCSESNDINPSSVSGYNYTDYYIDQFIITSKDHELSAGGSNIFPKDAGKLRSESGGSCCIGIPAHWRPNVKLVIKWRRDSRPYDKDRSGDQWLTATTEVPPYGPRTYGFVVHFLPGDRIRVEIEDKPEMAKKPADNDPYIVQGVLDPELNKKQGGGR
ncbi:DUF3304 domain-containing protein [Burkholderia multivorans]|uniref:DUF3304 domain-containing protein n=1 Tax=Burkholderia multivorans TaxID=87883 RepID=UPI00123B7A77|nr:DUF3304 domain-containing protein [Burkholderia multivorans]QET33369.1 DUF3304 domain-containing protein [Burkholderia multivorans]QET36832.1 DUF3304 domain-containing protein [Burkholderia multivorans]